MDLDFSQVAQEQQRDVSSSDFAQVTQTSEDDAPKALPLKTAILSVATAGDEPVDTILSMQEEALQSARDLINSGQEFQSRLAVASKQQKRTLSNLQNLINAPTVISPEVGKVIDDTYRRVAEKQVEDNARTSAEIEAVRKIQDHLAAGETVEAKLSYDLLTKGGAEDRWHREAVKNLILGQYIEKLQAESGEESIGGKVWNFMTSLIPFGYNSARSNVLPGYDSSWKEFFLSGSGLAAQGESLWGKYDDPADLQKALAPGGELDASIRSNATTLGGFDPSTAAEITAGLKYTSYEGKVWANLWGTAGEALNVLPGIGVIPWRGGTNMVGNLTRLGSRSKARALVADAFKTVIEQGDEAAATKLGLPEAKVTEHLEPTSLNPNVSTENIVPHAVDVDTHLRAAESALQELPTSIQVSRATTPEEISHAYEAAIKAEEHRLGKSVKDVKFMYEDVRTGERFEFQPGKLPEQGNVIHFVEYTVGKKSGGGFASAKTAMADATKRGLAGAEAEFIGEVGERVVTNADEGFTARVYHGTAHAFDDFDAAYVGRSTGGENTRGGVVFFSDNPDVANSFARKASSSKFQDEISRLEKILKASNTVDEQTEEAYVNALEGLMDERGLNIRPVDVNPEKLFEVDMKGASYNGPTTQSIIDHAKNNGYGGVVFKNFDDDILGGKLSNVYALWDKNVYRTAFNQRVVRDVSGQWFVKNRVNVKEEGFFTTPLNTPDNNFMSGLRSDARRIDRSSQMKAVAAGQNAERVASTVSHEMKNALKGLSKHDKRYLDEIIRKGQNEAKWLSEREFNMVFERVAGEPPSPRVVDAYNKYRLFNDIEYILRNDELYKSLAVRGYETVAFDVGPTGVRFNGTAFAEAAPKTRPVERVYNASDNVHYTSNNMLTSEELDRLTGEGYLLIKTQDPVLLPDGVVVRNFLVKRGALERKPLERTQLGYSEGGHRAYTGKYFAKQATSGVQPDTGSKFLKNPNVFRTSNNRNRLRNWADVMNRAIDDANEGILDPQHFDDNVFNVGGHDLQFPTGAQFVEAVEKGQIDLKNRIEIVGDREMPSAYSAAREDVAKFVDEEETATNGYYRTTGRLYSSRKGEHLLDESGEFAETVDPWETMNTAMFNISRMSSLSNYKTSTLERFARTYGNHLALRSLDITSPADLLKAELREGTPATLGRQIKAEQAAIGRILRFETKFEKGVRQAHRELAEWVLGDAEGGWRESAHDFVYWLEKNNPVRFLRSLAFDVKLGMFNFGQVLLQSSTIMAATALHPTHGWQGMKTMVPLFSYILSKSNENVLDVLSKNSWKTSGFASEAEYKEFFRFVDRTGFMNVGNTHLLINDFGPNRVYGASSMVDAVREKGRAFFYSAEMFNRAVASRIAYNILKEEGLEVGTAAFRERFIGIADDLSLNMTNESAASFQHGLMSIPTQFWAYNIRMMDAMFGNNFTKAQRARLIGSQFLLFGAGGVPVVDAIADWYKRNTGEPLDIDTFMGTLDRGMIDKAIAELGGADVRFGERVGTGSFLTDTIKDVFGMGEYGEKSPAEALGGATYSISAQIGKTLGDAVSYAFAESGGTGDFTLTRDNLLKLAMNVSTLSNATKAILAYNYGIYKSNKGTVQAADLPQADAFWIAMGLRPQEMDDLSSMKSYLDNKDKTISEAATQLRNWRQEAFSNPDVYEENKQKANAFINLLPKEIRRDVLKRTNRITDKSFYEHIERKYREEMENNVNGE
jgi:hypothetical protein